MIQPRLAVDDVLTTTHGVLQLIQQSPPHVRPWLRGIEAETEHIQIELAAADRRAQRRFSSWLASGAEEEADGV